MTANVKHGARNRKGKARNSISARKVYPRNRPGTSVDFPNRTRYRPKTKRKSKTQRKMRARLKSRT